MKRYNTQFWLLCFSSFLFFGSFNMVLPEMPNFMRSIGAEKYIGFHIALFTLTAGLSRPFSGKLTDNWGRIPVMVVGSIVTAVISILYPFFLNITAFLVLRLLHGFSTGFKPTGTTAYIGDIVPVDRRGEAMGLVSFFGMIGMGLGNWAGPEIVLLTGNFNVAFYASSGVALFSILILLGMKESLPTAKKFNWNMLKINAADLYEPAALRPATIILFTTFSFGVIVTMVPDVSEHLGIRNKGAFFVYFTLSSLVSRLVGGRLSDIFGRVPVLRISTLTVALSCFMIGYSTTSFMFFGGALVFGFGYGLTSPTLFAWVVDLCPAKFRGRGISTAFLALEIGIGVGAMLTGILYQSDITQTPLIFSMAGSLGIIAFIYLIFSRPKTT